MPEEEPSTKKCPFNGAWCEKNVCALYVEFGQQVGTMRRVVGMCVFVGTNQILSEMNINLAKQSKLPVPQIQIPHLGRV